MDTTTTPRKTAFEEAIDIIRADMEEHGIDPDEQDDEE